MGILTSGILGPVRNKTGSIVGRVHKRKNVVTGLYNTSNKPPTKDQLEARFKLGLLNGFMQDIDELVNIGFKAYIKKESAVNVAVSYNYDHAFVKEGENTVLNYPKIVYSRGHIVTPESPEVFQEPGTLTFNWLPQNQSAYCQFTDRASFLIYNPAKDLSIILPNVTNRYAQGYTLEIPEGYIGDTLHCYMNFRAADGKKTGDSMYVGKVVV